MGHERKRGKLADLNALLRGAGSDAFSLIVGNTAVLPGSQVCDHPRYRYAVAAGVRLGNSWVRWPIR